MKKTILALSLGALAFSASAQLNGDGFYRVRNTMSERYCYLLDCHGYVNASATYVDVTAIELFKDTEMFLSDPSTIFYIEKQPGTSYYDLIGQGYSVHDMVGEYLKIAKYPDEDCYMAYGSLYGVRKDLGDGDYHLDREHSYMTANPVTTPNDMRKWDILPMSDATNYLGVKPTVEVGGQMWASWYCGFSYGLSEGLEAYVVKEIDARRAVAILEPLGSDAVGEGVPVLIKCNGATAADNKVTVGTAGTTPSGSMLVGVYFDCDRDADHRSYTANNQATMRHIGVTSEGYLGMVTIDDYRCPRNAGYLAVPEGTPAELRLVTRAEYEEILAQPILPSDVVLNKTQATMLVDDTMQLTATVNPDDTTDPTVTWSSSNSAIASVDANGLVTAVGQGTATITATCQQVSATCAVTVNKHQQTITWNQTFDGLYDNDQVTLNATASSGLEVTYAIIQGQGSIEGGVLSFTEAGDFQITANQSGNYKYDAAPTVTKSFNVTAGLADIMADGLSISGRTILNPAGAKVEVYNILGSKVYSGNDASMDLRPGLYIVRTPESNAKVRIK